jgi:hypothetical protein
MKTKFFIHHFNAAGILKLHIAINKDRATFSGIIDFKKDDDYYGIQKKFTGNN